MKDDQLYRQFQEAVTYINGYTEGLPADFLLKLYAYYKIANQNFENPGSKTPLINAFKVNALIQAKNISPEEAMQNYIDLVEKLKQE